EAMKGMKWESPRGPISIDPQTRDIVQNIYIRRVEKVDGELYNVEFATFEAVKDSGKTKKGSESLQGNRPLYPFVMPGQKREARLRADVPGIHVFLGRLCKVRRGWPGQARP